MRSDAEEEFAEFVRARQHALVRFGYLLTGDRMAAEDLTQTALARLYLKWDTIRQAGAMEAWVRRVMVNEHTSWWRRAWRRRETVDFDATHLADRTASTDPGPVSPDDSLWQHVLRLPPRQRAAVALRYYEDLSEAQTAEVLGCSIGTVKSQTHRALATLRSRLAEVPA
ncbi:SigE family RNA polymerase sigma factor [Intrasporangium calvum]|uniref:SigE family RNA polymerase sigma factor n=1 Tax=Intrasporangium calvum TaxID=53358 RepID=A0ABT5GFU7_9MICO|nr:SigE family RNA polymerase sigma factor [Intrasporangium calvum]MDC5697145.1 SigE family RNA polymerase sigma factor [Intrasporangium calvum]